ncbi:MAG: Alpha-D-ribose 1-methylphosphonate 5-phosphate C-P lyase PhnJ, partial [uncultured Chloroflexia bacterium]
LCRTTLYRRVPDRVRGRTIPGRKSGWTGVHAKHGDPKIHERDSTGGRNVALPGLRHRLCREVDPAGAGRARDRWRHLLRRTRGVLSCWLPQTAL